MSQYYDGSGRMRERPPSLLRGLTTTVTVLKFVALFGFIISYPLWGRLISPKAL